WRRHSRQSIEGEERDEEGGQPVKGQVDQVEPERTHPSRQGPVESEAHAGQRPVETAPLLRDVPVRARGEARQVPAISHERILADDRQVVEDEVVTQRRKVEEDRKEGEADQSQG